MTRAPQYELSGAEEVFNLRQEETQDGQRVSRERQQRERDLKEAAEREAKLQLTLL